MTLIKQIETITVTPDKKFNAKEFFKDWSKGSNFEKHFPNQKESTAGKAVQIAISELTKYSLDAPIIKDLGGIEKATITLAEFAAIAATGRTFVAYVKDGDEVPWALYCDQVGVYRIVVANSVERPGKWLDGLQFASRNSSDAQTPGPKTLSFSDPLTLEVIINGVEYVPKA